MKSCMPIIFDWSGLTLRFKVKVKLMKMANNLLNIARRALECIGHLFMYAEHFRLFRFDLEVQGQGQTMKMANNLLNIARRALECIGHL